MITSFSLFVSYLEEFLLSASNWLVDHPTKFRFLLERREEACEEKKETKYGNRLGRMETETG